MGKDHGYIPIVTRRMLSPALSLEDLRRVIENEWTTLSYDAKKPYNDKANEELSRSELDNAALTLTQVSTFSWGIQGPESISHWVYAYPSRSTGGRGGGYSPLPFAPPEITSLSSLKITKYYSLSTNI